MIATNVPQLSLTESANHGHPGADHERHDQGQGGTYPLDVYMRMVVHLRARAQETPDMTVWVEYGYAASDWAGGDSPLFVAPSTSGAQRWDLLYFDSTNTLTVISGSEVVGALSVPVQPAIPAAVVPVCYVLLYEGMTEITENDISDARTPFALTLPSGFAVPIPIAMGGTGQITALLGFNALSPLTALGQLLSQNGTNNVAIAGNTTATRKFLRQVGTGSVSALADWDTLAVGDIPAGAIANAPPEFSIDGVLIVATEVRSYVVTSAGSISAVYIYCKTPGTVGTTTIDVHLNGTTIFTTQANRPALAWNDANKVAKSGTPDITAVVENDVLTVDIDGVATGAADLAIIINMSGGSGGSGGHVIQEEGTPLTARANLNFVGVGVTATDDAGNNASVITIPDVAAATHAASAKSPPIDNDELPIADSAATYSLKHVLWSVIKSTLKTYFDTLYAASGSGVTGSGTSGKVAKWTGTSALGDATNTDTEVADAVTKKHSQQHSIVATADHTSTATAGKVLKADANGLPVGATNTDTEVASAVSLKHTQNTDTALGALSTKNPPIDADKAVYRDSTAADALVTSTWTQIKAFLKTYFDTLYAVITHTHTAGQVVIVRQALFTYTGNLAVGAGTLRIYNKTGATITVSQVFLGVDTAPTGAAIIVDCNKNGITLFTTQSNRPQIAISAFTGYSTTLDVTTLADGDYLSADIDQIGSTITGADMTVHVVYS